MKTKTLHQDVFVGLTCLALALWFFYLNRALPSGAALMPRLLSALLAVLAVAIVISGVQKSHVLDSEKAKPFLSWDICKVPFIAWCLVAAYILLFLFCGYFVSTAVMLVVFMRYMKQTSWTVIAAITVGYLVLVYLFFVKQFGLNVFNLGLLGKLF